MTSAAVCSLSTWTHRYMYRCTAYRESALPSNQLLAVGCRLTLTGCPVDTAGTDTKGVALTRGLCKLS